MLASTMHFSNNTHPQPANPPPAITTGITRPTRIASTKTTHTCVPSEPRQCISSTAPVTQHDHPQPTAHTISHMACLMFHPMNTHPPNGQTPPAWECCMLLRKEVIQPHLPVRLPCYDFVPIADPTFDSSLPQGVRPPASGVTDFHDVTGGVYKARERIHRSVADLRLLATPTSRGRVADPDPN